MPFAGADAGRTGGALATLLVAAACFSPFPARGAEPAKDGPKEQPTVTPDASSAEGTRRADDLPKTLDEWRKRLTPEQFHVTRMKGTERAFTGKYWNTTTAGTYCCVCCGEPLFRSGEKFESGCGWPSFSAPIDGVKGQTIAEHLDLSHGMRRTEVTCRRCGAHLGHVFDDGPPPTGLRYCINSASIVLEPKKPVEGGAAAGSAP
ncbi:MAG: peptide-methionine (R)-S-oxide reductase, partial [Planctomycetia bacterium]|nr:peptide-methionine (R)-S-oxide reductase [Planctomycetia bacterium]